MTGPSLSFPNDKKVFCFTAIDQNIKFGHDECCYQFTLDGRWTRVGIFNEPLPKPYNVIHQVVLDN